MSEILFFNFASCEPLTTVNMADSTNLMEIALTFELLAPATLI